MLLPLWTPSHILIGAVGYHSKPSGEFVTLLNAFHPIESSAGKAKDMPSLYGYGDVPMHSQKADKRSLAQRTMDLVQGVFSKSKSDGAL